MNTDAASELSSAGLEQFLGYAIRRAQLAIFQDFNRRMADLDISTVQFSILRLAHDNPGHNQRALAMALGIETSRMVLILDVLERRDLLARRTSVRDRRAREIWLTPVGARLLKVLERRVVAHERAFAKRLCEEDSAALLRMLTQLAKPG